MKIFGEEKCHQQTTNNKQTNKERKEIKRKGDSCPVICHNFSSVKKGLHFKIKKTIFKVVLLSIFCHEFLTEKLGIKEVAIKTLHRVVQV